MNELIDPTEEVGRIAKFQSLQAGQYWRARDAISDEMIEAGEVLLIESLKWVDDAVHTVVLRTHPGKYDRPLEVEYESGGRTYKTTRRFKHHDFFLKDFLAAFDFEPDHKRVRDDELAQVQARITGLQSELLEAQSNPAILASVVAAELSAETTKSAPQLTQQDEEKGRELLAQSQAQAEEEACAQLATGTLSNAIGSGLTAQNVEAMKSAASREFKIATIKSNWITSKTTEIANTIQAMTPYYSEQAACALAKTEDVRTYVHKLMKGIESLDLYVGTNVEVKTIRSGESAPRETPLTIMQRKLLMDEELAVWADVDASFDFTSIDRFLEALRDHDGLVNQIFPTERCALVMATTSRYLDYGHPLASDIMNQKNHTVFLMVRDGQNIHQVISGVTSHLGAARLFPNKDDHDRLFKGFDGTTIKFEDVAYADRHAAHENMALHYKRFLILACGLDHRLKLFGDFYEGPQSFDFVSMAFQERWMRFIHDDDASLMIAGTPAMPSLKEWLATKNAGLAPGSRVLCNWYSLMNPRTAPGACKDDYSRSSRRGFEFRYSPAEKYGLVVPAKSGRDIVATVAVSGENRRNWNDRSFDCKVTISAFRPGEYDSDQLPYLVLDNVEPEELLWYVHSRTERAKHIEYVRFFKTALKHLTTEREAEAQTRSALRAALDEGNVGLESDRDELVKRAVRTWRSYNRGKALPRVEDGIAPKVWRGMLDLMFSLNCDMTAVCERACSWVADSGQTLLRASLAGNNKLVVYTATPESERDDRLVPHSWVERIVLDMDGDSFKEASRTQVALSKEMLGEVTLKATPEEDAWVGLNNVFSTPAQKREHVQFVRNGYKRIDDWIRAECDASTWSSLHAKWKEARDIAIERSRRIESPELCFPIGMVWEDSELKYLCLTVNPVYLLNKLCTDNSQEVKLRSSYGRWFASPEKASSFFTSTTKARDPWSLSLASKSLKNSEHREIACAKLGVECNSLPFHPSTDNTLATWLNRYKRYREKAKVWILPELLDENGNLAVDNMLGVSNPQDYAPTWVIQSECRAEGGELTEDLSKCPKWVDIVTAEMKDGEPVNDNHDHIHKARPASAGACFRTGMFLSRSEALAHAKQWADKLGLDLRDSKDVDGFVQPPAGVQRLVMVERQSGD